MSPLRKRVENSLFVLNEPTTLAERMVVNLVVDDEDDLGDDECRAFREALRGRW